MYFSVHPGPVYLTIYYLELMLSQCNVFFCILKGKNQDDNQPQTEVAVQSQLSIDLNDGYWRSEDMQQYATLFCYLMNDREDNSSTADAINGESIYVGSKSLT